MSKTRCDVCGNEYDKAFTIAMNGTGGTFDCFECAIERLAPRCTHCGCRILGHGVEARGSMYCGAHCAKESGVRELRDRA